MTANEKKPGDCPDCEGLGGYDVPARQEAGQIRDGERVDCKRCRGTGNLIFCKGARFGHHFPTVGSDCTRCGVNQNELSGRKLKGLGHVFEGL